MNHVVIMGRKTYDSIGHPLQNRTNIILTRDGTLLDRYDAAAHAEVMYADAPEYALFRANAYDDEVFIVGGAEIYKAFYPVANAMYITWLPILTHGDTKFPNYQYDLSWQMISSEHVISPEQDLFSYYRRNFYLRTSIDY